ncbi:MAG: beta-1,4-xylanase [Terriglobia bacterium]
MTLRSFYFSLFLIFSAPTLWAQGIPLNPPVPGSLGINIHFTNPAPGEMKEIADGGFRWVRMDLDWGSTERVKGKYDFSAYDKLLAALAPYHIRPILILDYSNKFYDHNLSPYDEVGRQAFANWVAAAVNHFHGRGVAWEMYNEPNWTFWRPKPNVQDYIKLALKVGETIEETDPGETYIGPAGALIDLPFLKACFEAGLLNYWSAVSVHPYRQRIPESVSGPYADLRKLIATYAPAGKTIPIIAGEWGYPSTPDWFNMSEAGQAQMLAREFLTNIAEGIPITIWYDWGDGNEASKSSDDHYGIVKSDYHQGGNPAYPPKPVYLAAQTLFRFFDGYTFRKRLAVGSPEDYVLLFTKQDGARLAAWTTGNAPEVVTIPGARGKFHVIGIVGAEMRGLRAHRHGLKITLSNSPQYLAPQKTGGLARVVAQK